VIFGRKFQDLTNATRRRNLGPRGGIFIVRELRRGERVSNALADGARQAVRLLAWQLSATLLCALTAAAVWGVKAGLSVCAGGVIGSIWTAYMAWALFRHSLNHGRGMSVMSFVGAWVIKLVLTVGLLAAAFASRVFLAPGLLAGLGLAMLAYWLVMVVPGVLHADSSDGK
jgi:F0F1-type ATP synthase assembly protein I